MTNKPKFDIRNLFTTSSVDEAFKDSRAELFKCLDRHFSNESDVNEEDKKYNEEAIKSKSGRVLSVFNTSKGKIYINTQSLEYMDNDQSNPDDREYYNTMVMFASEY